MMAAQAQTSAARPVDSPEVRWMVPGQLGTAMREWFARFPAGTEARADTYQSAPPGTAACRSRGYRAWALSSRRARRRAPRARCETLPSVWNHKIFPNERWRLFRASVSFRCGTRQLVGRSTLSR